MDEGELLTSRSTVSRRSRFATGPRRNAPSRWRLRPAFRLTAAEATADRRAINLGRSVLGASRTLGGRNRLVKKSGSEDLAICGIFFSHRVELRLEPHALVWRGQKKGRARRARPQEFAEPGTLSSTFPTNLPLPRSAPRGASSYRRPVLGAGRNLRQGDLADQGGPVKNSLALCGRSERPALRPATLGAEVDRTIALVDALARCECARDLATSRLGSSRARAGPGGRDRRRRRRLLDPLLADAARLGRRRPRRARRADERLDVPLGRARRPAARLAQPDEDDDELGRALPDARGGGRARDRLARGRLAAARLVARSAWRSSRARPAGRRRSACRSS